MWGCTQLDSMSGSSPSRDTEVIKAGGGGWRGGRSESMNTVDGRKAVRLRTAHFHEKN